MKEEAKCYLYSLFVIGFLALMTVNYIETNQTAAQAIAVERLLPYLCLNETQVACCTQFAKEKGMDKCDESVVPEIERSCVQFKKCMDVKESVVLDYCKPQLVAYSKFMFQKTSEESSKEECEEFNTILTNVADCWDEKVSDGPPPQRIKMLPAECNQYIDIPETPTTDTPSESRIVRILSEPLGKQPSWTDF
mmetsp:Transcript_43350/g.49853  ORF Transcript_43350/g.49853 Transcript_43350/m.49853 type:complete len:193 (+) Transcript_43350:89-667(+)